MPAHALNVAEIESLFYYLHGKALNEAAADPMIGRGDPHAVRIQARNLAARHYDREQEFGAIAEGSIAEAEFAGLFIYAAELYGLDYERLNAGTNPTIARAVSMASLDPRLTAPHRAKVFAAWLADANFEAVCARLAEILVSARALTARIVEDEDVPARNEFYKDWCTSRLEWLDAIRSRRFARHLGGAVVEAVAELKKVKDVRVARTRSTPPAPVAAPAVELPPVAEDLPPAAEPLPEIVPAAEPAPELVAAELDLSDFVFSAWT